MLYFVGIDEVINALKVADLGLIGIATVLELFTILLYAIRWKSLNEIANMESKTSKLLPMVLVSVYKSVFPFVHGSFSQLSMDFKVYGKRYREYCA